MRLVLLMLLTLGLEAPAMAQSSWSYRARVTAETTSTQANSRSPLVQARTEKWTWQHILVASADGGWTCGERLRAGIALTGLAKWPADVDLRMREAYGRVSATKWLDLEAGMRIVRWGVGYGFSPAGVLDPPRIASDPSDRLQLNKGRLLARADLFRGDSSLSLAVAEQMSAARVATVTRGGVEIAAIGAVSLNDAPRYGATVTHVIGQQLEWHAEGIVHEDHGARVASAAAGLQYTFTAGLDVVVEYHRNGTGLDSLFFRAARGNADAAFAPELILVAGVDDGGWTIVPSIGWRLHERLQAHVRVTRFTGPDRSLAAAAPFATVLTAGGSMRF